MRVRVLPGALLFSKPSAFFEKKNMYTGSSGRAHSTRVDSTHAHYKNVRIYIVKALKLPAKWVLFSIIRLDSTGAKSRSCGFF